MNKNEILNLLRAWINQRPGLEYCNYGDPTSYRSEMRRITNQKHDAVILLANVENSGITAEQLTNAFRAFSGRLQLKGDRLEYCTGQYWPTEYRAAACAVLAQALWDYHRPDVDDEEKPGDAIRAKFRRMFGRSIQQRWFD